MTQAGLEPAIPSSVGRCLIHWATGPSDCGAIRLHIRAFSQRPRRQSDALRGPPNALPPPGCLLAMWVASSLGGGSAGLDHHRPTVRARFHASLKRRLFPPTLFRTPRTPQLGGAGGQQATYAFSAPGATRVRVYVAISCCWAFVARPTQSLPQVTRERKAAQRWKLWVFWGRRERPMY